jgi:CRISPR-associated protein Cmr4
VSSNKLLVKVNNRSLPEDEKSEAVVLEEYKIEVEQTEYAKELAKNITKWLDLKGFDYIKENLIIIPDDYFKDFVKYNTEIITRIKIDNTKGTVAEHQMFTEELLPAETVMYSLVMASKIFLPEKAVTEEEKELQKAGLFVARDKSATVAEANRETDEGKYLVNKISKEINKRKYIQLGGDATIGKGLCLVNVFGGDTNEKSAGN